VLYGQSDLPEFDKLLYIFGQPALNTSKRGTQEKEPKGTYKSSPHGIYSSRKREKARDSMQTTAALTADYLATPDSIADPYPAYQQLRDQSPVNYLFLPGGLIPGIDEPLRSWGLMKFADVYGALRDHDTFSSARNPLNGKIGPKIVLITDDPPRHAALRRLVNKAFTLRRIEALGPWITEIANALVDEMGDGSVDIVPSYTVPLPIRVIARMLGIPSEENDTFKHWSDMLVAQARTPEEAAEQAKSSREMGEYFGRLTVARRAHGAEDLITAVVESEVEGESLQDWEAMKRQQT
jgi:cytochrome P450